jgi:ElaB/YqjD/DUF883 family membrane-anchored ribosome-binding protein
MPDSNGTQKSKERLQQQVEAKRDEIVNTVDEIRLTLSEEMRERKRAVKDAMDWRYYVRKQPVACLGGAAAVGFFLGKMITDKIMESQHEPDWSERAHDYADRAGRKFDEWSGRAIRGESKMKARGKSMFSSSTDILFRELAKAAQNMIIPTVVAAVTGKMASDNKTTVIEKNVHKAPPGQPDHEYTTDTRTYDKDGNREA